MKNNKRKGYLLMFLVLVLLLPSVAGCGSRTQGNVVSVYNWGEYIDKDLLKAFEEETGIQVIYSTFNTNEDLYVKLKGGGTSYDVIVPSDYMIERMAREGMLREINWDNIPNLSVVDKEYLYHSYDPEQKYSAPYFWGTLGILYNTTLVDEPVDSWEILWKEKYHRKIIMLDSSRDSLGIALKMLSYSMNSRNEEEMGKAADLLIEQYPLVYAYLVDQTRDIMINGEAALAVMYSGDAVDAISENEDLAYAVPKEGSNLWFDSMVIPKNARNPENAEKFINFMLRAENMAQNAEYVWYSVPSSEAKELLDEELSESEVAYPDKAILENLEVFRDPGEMIKKYDDLWQKVKNQ